MRYDPDIHHRRSIRLRGYDYAVTGAYFVTVCAQGRECLFGKVEDGGVVLNEIGRTIDEWWHKLPEKFAHVRLDQSAIMPNHFHAIISLVGADPCVRPGSEPDLHVVHAKIRADTRVRPYRRFFQGESWPSI